MKPATALVGLSAILAMGTAQGKACKGVDFPEHLQVSGTDLTLNGLGMHKATFLQLDVYVGALYVTEPSRDPNALIASDTTQELVLHFVRSVSVDILRRAFTDWFARVPQDQAASLDQKVATITSWLSDVKSGQRLTFVRKSHEGIQVNVNGADKGTIPGDDFSRAFVTVWLGARPPSKELKRGLLGGECE